MMEKEKEEEKIKEERAKEELYIQEREKLYQEQMKKMRSDVRTQLKKAKEKRVSLYTNEKVKRGILRQDRRRARVYNQMLGLNARDARR